MSVHVLLLKSDACCSLPVRVVLEYHFHKVSQQLDSTKQRQRKSRVCVSAYVCLCLSLCDSVPVSVCVCPYVILCLCMFVSVPM